jgi:hypothetical protein
MKRDCVKPRVVCHACGKEGHIRPDCPNKTAGGWPVKVGDKPGGRVGSSSGGGNSGKNNNGKRGRPFGKLNCTSLEEANKPETELIGTLNILTCPGKVLFDTGATTSSISKHSVNKFGIR